MAFSTDSNTKKTQTNTTKTGPQKPALGLQFDLPLRPESPGQINTCPPSPSISVHSSISQRNTPRNTPQIHPLLRVQSDFFARVYCPDSQATSQTLAHSASHHRRTSLSNLDNSLLPTDMSHYSSSSNTSSGHQRPPRPLSNSEITQMITVLIQRRVNTLTELRRIERKLSSLETFEVHYMPTVTDAWSHYVSSNNFLNELRGLTREYPFSSELLNEAKVRVLHDPSSSRSWNFVWLLLQKIQHDHLIPHYAVATANQPAMWGGVVPDPHHSQQLAQELIEAWDRAANQMLRHWPNPPTMDGGW